MKQLILCILILTLLNDYNCNCRRTKLYFQHTYCIIEVVLSQFLLGTIYKHIFSYLGNKIVMLRIEIILCKWIPLCIQMHQIYIDCLNNQATIFLSYCYDGFGIILILFINLRRLKDETLINPFYVQNVNSSKSIHD